jgi:hypothetical protein
MLALSQRSLRIEPTFPLSYRGGQLVVEYTTLCFRSQEDCAPDAETEFFGTSIRTELEMETRLDRKSKWSLVTRLLGEPPLRGG